MDKKHVSFADQTSPSNRRRRNGSQEEESSSGESKHADCDDKSFIDDLKKDISNCNNVENTSKTFAELQLINDINHNNISKTG